MNAKHFLHLWHGRKEIFVVLLQGAVLHKSGLVRCLRSGFLSERSGYGLEERGETLRYREMKL